MAFTGRLGTSDSQLGNIVLGSIGSGVTTYSGSFTADAYIDWPLIFKDDFSRTAGTLVGPASHLGNWGLPHGYGSSFGGTVNGSAWQVEAYPAEGYVSLGTLPYLQDVYFEFNSATDTYLFYNAPAYFNGVDYTYANIEIYEDTPGNWILNAGDGSDVSAPITTGVTHSVRLLLDPENDQVKVKIWETGDPEPSAWLEENGCVTSASYISDLATTSIFLSWWTGDGTDPKTIEYITVSSSESSGSVGILTADAVLKGTVAYSFTADAVLDNGGSGTTAATFTADAFLLIPNITGSFTANALLKKINSSTFTANARLVSTTAGSFTADAHFKSSVTRSFTADAVIFRAPVEPAFGFGGSPRLRKTQTLNILSHRPKPLPVFIPPRTPTDDEVPDEGPGTGGPGCLPPCPGSGAGYGTGYGTNGGAIVSTITKCNHCNNYFNSGEGYLGKGNIAFNTHCGCDTSHSYANHINRMWITYSNMPTGKFRMRAKMVWDIGATTTLTVNVYAGATAPTLDIGDCDSTASYWDSGMLVGKMVFIADGDGTIGERDVWYQTNPSELVLDAGAIGGNTFRFEITDESSFYRAEFKAANVQIVTD